MSIFERIVWWLIWRSHWLNGHQTLPLKNDPDNVWCVDCLRVCKRYKNQKALLG